MFSNALSRGSRRCSWKMNATSRRSPPRPRLHKRWRLLPRTHSSPALGRSCPCTRRSSVVLPEPLGPVTSNSSPWPTLTLTPFRTGVRPYDLDRPTSLTAGSGASSPFAAGRVFNAPFFRVRAATPLPFWCAPTRPVVAGRLPTLSSRLAHARSVRKLNPGRCELPKNWRGLRTCSHSTGAAPPRPRS